MGRQGLRLWTGQSRKGRPQGSRLASASWTLKVEFVHEAEKTNGISGRLTPDKWVLQVSESLGCQHEEFGLLS